MRKLNKATLLIILSLLVLALTLMATFSWLPRAADYETSQSYGNLRLNTTARLKYDDLTVQTTKTVMAEGKLDEGAQQILSNGSVVTVPANGTVYFRTVITNKQSGTINVSLDGLKLATTGSNISVCMLSPMKTSDKYTAAQYSAGVTLAEHIEATQSTPTVVEWYLYNSTASDVDVTLTQLPQISY